MPRSGHEYPIVIGEAVMKDRDVKTFVKKTLGCACPEEVFNYIDCQAEVKLTDSILLANKINIGNRLLVYVIRTGDLNLREGNLPTLVYMGKEERDRAGFNRFRLVIATDKVDEVQQAAGRIFENLEGRDERIHLHVISSSQI